MGCVSCVRFSFATCCSVRPHLSSDCFVDAAFLLCITLFPDALRGGTVLDPCCLVLSWAQGVGSFFWHGRQLDVSRPGVCLDFSSLTISDTMSCKWRTPGLREGDCLFEPLASPDILTLRLSVGGLACKLGQCMVTTLRRASPRGMLGDLQCRSAP